MGEKFSANTRLVIRVTDAQMAALRAKSDAALLKVSTWARKVLLEAKK